jgi:WD40 repeat protein
MMVGTFGHEIIELPINLQMNSCNIAQAKILINGHFAPMTTYTNEVWGLSIFPNQEKFATCSDDAKLKIWDTQTRKLIKSISLNIDKTGQPIPLDPTWKDLAPAAQGRSLDVSPKGDFLAVGMKDGTMRIF